MWVRQRRDFERFFTVQNGDIGLIPIQQMLAHEAVMLIVIGWLNVVAAKIFGVQPRPVGMRK